MFMQSGLLYTNILLNDSLYRCANTNALTYLKTSVVPQY